MGTFGVVKRKPRRRYLLGTDAIIGPDMQRDTTKKFYLIHSWLGIVTAIVLFIIAFSGAVSVFGTPELKRWASPALHSEIAVDEAAIAALTEHYAQQVPENYRKEIQVLMPGAFGSGNLHLLFETEHGKDERMMWFSFDPHSLALQNQAEGTPHNIFDAQPMDMEEFITHFHADLHMGKLGLIITGCLGLTLFGSVTTGLVIHRKILKELFIFRPFRSLRLLLTDSHKAVGVWGLLFHSMIGFTGAFLGLASILLLPAAALVTFQGDQEKLIETYFPSREPTLSHQPATMKLEKVLKHARASGAQSRRLTIYGWGDENAMAFVSVFAHEGTAPHPLAGETFAYQLADGEFIERTTTYSKVGGVSGPILDTMFPLHFGNFGGLLVRVIWGILGLTTALLAATGAMIWIEKRAYGPEGKLPKSQYLWLSKWVIGSCSGMVLATASLFYWQRLWPDVLAYGFFSVWLISIGFALVLRNNYQSNRILLGSTAVLLMLTPILDALCLDLHLFNSFKGTHTALAITDAVLASLGLALLGTVVQLPTTRPVAQHKRKPVTPGVIMEANS